MRVSHGRYGVTDSFVERAWVTRLQADSLLRSDGPKPNLRWIKVFPVLQKMLSTLVKALLRCLAGFAQLFIFQEATRGDETVAPPHNPFF